MSESITTPTPSSTPSGWLWRPNLIVFISNACIMTLELVAGRIIAPYVGVSLYTWTSIIGIILAGISLGNYLGGLAADRWASLRLLGLIFLAGGSTSLFILAVREVNAMVSAEFTILPRILLLTTILFITPAVILGMTSPIVAKLAVEDLEKTGVTVGKIYAFGTAGSIFGTFATGFYLIAMFGTHTIVIGVAILIISMGILMLAGGRAIAFFAILPVAAAIVFAMRVQDWDRAPCNAETNYFCIRITSDVRDGEEVRIMVLDRLVHSFNSLDDPTHLTYTYEKMYAELITYKDAADGKLDTLFIGGGGYTFPRYMETLYPNSHLDVIEIDPVVTEVAYRMMGLSRDSEISSFNEDARMFLAAEPSRQYDIVFGDAFNDYSVPYHLTTNEFNQLVDNWLAPDGMYIINIIDGISADFVSAFVHTLQQTFDNVYLVPNSDLWQTAPHGTFVVVATDQELNLDLLQEINEADGLQSQFMRQLLPQSEVDGLLEREQPVLLTDLFAPVEQMLAPAFRDEGG